MKSFVKRTYKERLKRLRGPDYEKFTLERAKEQVARGYRRFCREHMLRPEAV